VCTRNKAIVSVIALFPFGLEKPLRYLSGEDVWQTRFLAPSDMKDGSYSVRLLLRDTNGQVYRESKELRDRIHSACREGAHGPDPLPRGETIQLKVSASASTRTLTRTWKGLAPVNLHWNSGQEASTGQIGLPVGLPAGEYVLAVTAEDVAHNLGSAEVRN